MVSIAVAIQLSVLGFSLAAPLGPVNMEIIKQAFQKSKGFILGLMTGVGAMSADFVIAMTVLFIGSEVLGNLISNDWIRFFLFILNAAILSFIGLSAFRSAPSSLESMEDVPQTGNSSILRQYAFGFFLVSTSPWSYLWWMSFGPVVLSLDIPLATFGERAVAALLFLSGIFAWVFLFSLLLATSNRYASDRVINLVTKGSALLILLFAIRVLINALAIFFW
ncbi:MAG: hypothetical protein D6732_14855 [Methanobacteriota archaeon]|nr:MAG: hypothetical protein D6732_14855 [Euryarchaeota archaeon]